MGWLIKLMNIAAPTAALVSLLFISPLYFAFDILRSIKRRFSSENVAGKVVLITGASSGIGERGACLAITARREDRLQAVAEKAKKLGCPDVLAIPADVSKPHDCKTVVDRTVTHFGQLDHLVNNAGVVRASVFQDCNDVSSFAPIMDTNFWGSVHCTHPSIPHLKKTKGKIVVISSIESWLPMPKLSFYNASKAAMTSFFETLRVELGSQIGITIVTPGIICSEMTSIELLKEVGAEVIVGESAEVCAKEIVESCCRGDRHLIVPSFNIVSYILKIVSPDLLDWILDCFFYPKSPNSTKKQA